MCTTQHNLVFGLLQVKLNKKYYYNVFPKKKTHSCLIPVLLPTLLPHLLSIFNSFFFSKIVSFNFKSAAICPLLKNKKQTMIQMILSSNYVHYYPSQKY